MTTKTKQFSSRNNVKATAIRISSATMAFLPYNTNATTHTCTSSTATCVNRQRRKSKPLPIICRFSMLALLLLQQQLYSVEAFSTFQLHKYRIRQASNSALPLIPLNDPLSQRRQPCQTNSNSLCQTTVPNPRDPAHIHNNNLYRLIPRRKHTRRNVGQWDGDDIRWIQKIKRRLYRGSLGSMSGYDTPAISSLIGANLLMFVYQTINTVQLIKRRNPQFWPSAALSMVLDTLLGSTNVRGGLTTDFVHWQHLSKRQPHRYLTAGFLHRDILHLLLNMDALKRLPTWLETGLGTPLFVTTYLVSIVTGNLAHSWSLAGTMSGTFCLGASGGICGIYGLMFVALSKMGQSHFAMQIIKSMALLILSGLFWDSVSNAAHMGGFLGGVVMGLLCVPSYQKSYSMRRKWSLEVDMQPQEYRRVMGFGMAPSQHGLIPVPVLWAIGGVLVVLDPKLRAIPACILRGLLKPGSFSSFWS